MSDLVVDAAIRPASSKKVTDEWNTEGGAVEGESLLLSDPDFVDGSTCAICLGRIPEDDYMTPQDCEHRYCGCCLLRWSTFKSPRPWCPQCRIQFEHVYTFRQLDGTLLSTPVVESVCFLLRTHWFRDFEKQLSRGYVEPVSDGRERPWRVSDDEYDYLDQDEELEDFYFSSAAGRARIVLSNRRCGENGFLKSGRRYAAPVNTAPPPSSSTGKGKARKGRYELMPGSTPVAYGSSPGGISRGDPGSGGCSKSATSRGGASSGGSGSGSSTTPAAGSGRRARRAARRAERDLQQGANLGAKCAGAAGVTD